MRAIPTDFPERFLERYTRLFGARTMDRIMDGFEASRQTWFRTNPLKESRDLDDVIEELSSNGVEAHPAVDWSDAGCVAREDRNALLASSVVEEGRIYVQGFASQLPVRVLEPEAEDTLLDLAAAPGSKTIQLAGVVPTADIAAVEIVRKRMFRLKDNLQRHGVSNVRVFHQDGTKVWRYRPEHFDRILLDAPCSSEGRFQLDDPDSYGFWSPGKTKEMVRRQRRLLFSAVHALKPGGTLVYSTCSLAPEENEGVVNHALETFGDCLDIEPIAFEAPERLDAMEDWGKGAMDPRVGLSCRLLPSERMEGFFVARFRKTATSSPPLNPHGKSGNRGKGRKR